MGSSTDRARAALNAMKSLGFPKKMAAQVLKKLLNLYGNNWELIEDENYRALADAILDSQENGSRKDMADNEQDPGETVNNEAGYSISRAASQDDQNQGPSPHKKNSTVPAPGETSKKRPISDDTNALQEEETDHSSLRKRPRRKCTNPVLPPQSAAAEERAIILAPPQPIAEEQPIVPAPHQQSPPAESSRRETQALVRSRQGGGIITYRKEKVLLNRRQANHDPSPSCLKVPKSEPGMENDAPDTSGPVASDTPLAVMHPDPSSSENNENSNEGTHATIEKESPPPAPAPAPAPPLCVPTNFKEQNENREKGKNHAITLCSNQNSANEGVTAVPDLNPSSSSSMDVMGSSPKGEIKISLLYSPDHPNFCAPSIDTIFKVVEDQCLKTYRILPPDFSLRRIMDQICQAALDLGTTGPDATSSQSTQQEQTALVAVPEPCLDLGEIRPAHDPSDISKGLERMAISVVNEFSTEKFPPCFTYIKSNHVYQNAYVQILLARIGEESCCADCYGDCTQRAVPCECAGETAGEFAYTSEGLVRREFLDECVTASRNPAKRRLVCCKDCPLERSKGEECKGHLERKFIKECWSKCGCGLQCGNRVVQRGIVCRLQVYMTKEGKGWGLRVLDEIPKGSFVCEYVGEVLTTSELQQRRNGVAQNLNSVILDAGWASESVLRDDHALSLDSSFYGNVSRFINHRCYDANLVEVPVEVETPDHHYYHLAFFTTRKIEVLEELTWDYGIDFDNSESSAIEFRCRCGSKYCRDLKKPRHRRKH